MRRAIVAIALAAATGLVSAQQPVFRAGAQTVSVYATVHDREGHLVPGLTKADFQVFDDGQPATITTFSNDVMPATLALMLDMSTSMFGEHVRVRDAALHFVDALLPEDRVRIGTFGDELALSPWLTADKAILGRILREEVWPGGNTPLWAAMRAAMSSIAAEPGRRVVLTLTDGIDTGCPRLIGSEPGPEASAPSDGGNRVVRLEKRSSSGMDAPVVRTMTVGSARRSFVQGAGRQLSQPSPTTRCASYLDVERLSLEAEFMVYAIGMEGPGLSGGLVKLSDESGGGHFELKKNEDLTAAFNEVATELHHQYALGFTPVALDGRIHPLEVRLTRAGLTARARKSYVAVDR